MHVVQSDVSEHLYDFHDVNGSSDEMIFLAKQQNLLVDEINGDGIVEGF